MAELFVENITPEQVANVRRWIEALRSGAYKQGHGRLHSLVNGEDTYCCLGVACVVLDMKWDMWEEDIGLDYRALQALGMYEGTLLGSTTMGELLHEGNRESLVSFNDYHRMSLAEIADVIEQELSLALNN